MESKVLDTKLKLERSEIFKISKFKEVIKRTRPHKHEGYYEIITLLEGEGFHWIEEEKFQVHTPDLYFLKPGQVHYWQFTSIPKGYVLMFKEEFINPIQEVGLDSLIRQMNRTVRLELEQDNDLSFLFDTIYNNYKEPKSHGEDIILGSLRILLAEIAQQSNTKKADEIENPLLKRFISLLQDKCPQFHRVTEFSELLQTSPQKLNQVCQVQLGLNASQLIATHLLLEAKRNILHTDLTVNELADHMHFNDASYFIKFFKKHTGKTIRQFRQDHAYKIS